MWGYVIVGSYLVERGNGSWGVAAEAIASLDCGDGALEVSTVQQLRELQEAVAQDKQLGQTDSIRGLSLQNRNTDMWKEIDVNERKIWKILGELMLHCNILLPNM